MLAHPTQERLLTLGLTGMAKALDDQRRQPDIVALDFEERLALLLDRETMERENKRLVARLRFAALRQEAVVEDVDLRAPRGLDRGCSRSWQWVIGLIANRTCWSSVRPSPIHSAHVAMPLQRKGVLARIFRRRPSSSAIISSTRDFLLFEVRSSDGPGRTFAELASKQDPVGNQPSYRRFAYLKGSRGFLQGQFAALRALSLAIGEDRPVIAQNADPRAGPAIASARGLAGSVEHGRDGLIRHLASQRGHQFDYLGIRSPPMLTDVVLWNAERRMIAALHGLLPPHVGTLDEQVARRLEALRGFETDLERYDFLRDMQDNNETAFYSLLRRHVEEMLPLVYTPTVGLGCERFSHIYRKPRGLFLSLPNGPRIANILASPRFDAVTAIVVTDGERILGLGDLGAGGMGIPIGKLSLYIACGGLHPSTTLPILLDVGTDRQDLLSDPLYLGWRHQRVRGEAYDAFIEVFVAAVAARWPHVLLQWEDFARDNATRLLERYRDRLCTFNDDIQGSAAVVVGTLLAALDVTGVPLVEQRIAILGAGSAGCGIAGLLAGCLTAAGLEPEAARRAVYMVDVGGLLVDGMDGLLPFQAPFAKSRAAVTDWQLDQPHRIGLLDVVRNARPTALVGVSGQGGVFTEAVIREMAAHATRPVILPLSNPTTHSEAKPADLLAWTEGRALVGTGSPFPRVERSGRPIRIAQTNNVYIFPGLALGVIAARAKRVTDGMLMAAARALADSSPTRHDPDAPLLPPVAKLREVAMHVAISVAEHACREGVNGTDEPDLAAAITAQVWTPDYRPYAATGK